MSVKLISAAVTAAFLAFGTAAWAQSSSSKAGSSSDKAATPPSTSSSGSAGASATPSKCVGLTGAERDKCMKDEKSASGSTSKSNGGSSASGATSGSSPSGSAPKSK